MTPTHCCHDKGEPCRYGWSDVHFHRCVPPEKPASAPSSHEQPTKVSTEVQR